MGSIGNSRQSPRPKRERNVSLSRRTPSGSDCDGAWRSSLAGSSLVNKFPTQVGTYATQRPDAAGVWINLPQSALDKLSFQTAEGLSREDYVPMPVFPTTVLVVEDELLIRMDVVNQLQTEGFQTLEAGTGQEALHEMEGDRQIDIVFTDVDMPGNVNGIVLAHKVREKWPSVGIIVTSGQAVISVGALPAGARFFSKPYEMKAIFAIIQELLA